MNNIKFVYVKEFSSVFFQDTTKLPYGYDFSILKPNVIPEADPILYIVDSTYGNFIWALGNLFNCNGGGTTYTAGLGLELNGNEFSQINHHTVILKENIITAEPGTKLDRYVLLCDNGDYRVIACNAGDMTEPYIGLGSFYWEKSILDTNVSAGIIFARAVSGLMYYRLTITPNDGDMEIHNIAVIIDTPSDGTFTCITSCPWDIECRYMGNLLYGLLQIPDSFEGIIKLEYIKGLKKSGSVFGGVSAFELDNNYDFLEYTSWLNLLPLTPAALINNDDINEGMYPRVNEDEFKTPFEKYSVDVIVDIPDLKVGDKVLDFTVNDYLLHSLTRSVLLILQQITPEENPEVIYANTLLDLQNLLPELKDEKYVYITTQDPLEVYIWRNNDFVLVTNRVVGHNIYVDDLDEVALQDLEENTTYRVFWTDDGVLMEPFTCTYDGGKYYIESKYGFAEASRGGEFHLQSYAINLNINGYPVNDYGNSARIYVAEPLQYDEEQHTISIETGHTYNKSADSLVEGTDTTLGNLNVAEGVRSHAEGINTIASGDCSHAEGIDNFAWGEASHAEGITSGGITVSGVSYVGSSTETIESSIYNSDLITLYEYTYTSIHPTDYPVLPGLFIKWGDLYIPIIAGTYDPDNNQQWHFKIATRLQVNLLDLNDYSSLNMWFGGAYGDNSHSEGFSSGATGYASHTEGEESFASGHSAHACGVRTFALNPAEFSCGFYNRTNRSTNGTNGTLFSIGAGTQPIRKNAVEVILNGDVYITGIGNYDGKNYGLLNVTSLQSNMTSLQSNMTSLQSNMTSLQSNMTLLLQAAFKTETLLIVNGTSQLHTTVTLLPNTFYMITTAIDYVDFDLASALPAPYLSEYHCYFTVGNVGDLTLPTSVQVPGNPQIDPGHGYEMSICNGICIITQVF